MAPVRRYTLFVALSKHSLWILAAVIMGVVVWIASDNTGENARLVFSNIPKTESALENIMMKPHYQGLDAHNRPYTVIAETAKQLDKENVAMDKVHADMTLSSGGWVAVSAGEGVINPQTKKLQLKGGVDLFYDGGYEFRTEHAQVDIAAGSAYGDAPVEGQGPPGTLKADSFSIAENGRIIRFNGSVRMTLYH